MPWSNLVDGSAWSAALSGRGGANSRLGVIVGGAAVVAPLALLCHARFVQTRLRASNARAAATLTELGEVDQDCSVDDSLDGSLVHAIGRMDVGDITPDFAGVDVSPLVRLALASHQQHDDNDSARSAGGEGSGSGDSGVSQDARAVVLIPQAQEFRASGKREYDKFWGEYRESPNHGWLTLPSSRIRAIVASYVRLGPYDVPPETVAACLGHQCREAKQQALLAPIPDGLVLDWTESTTASQNVGLPAPTGRGGWM